MQKHSPGSSRVAAILAICGLVLGVFAAIPRTSLAAINPPKPNQLCVAVTTPACQDYCTSSTAPGRQRCDGGMLPGLCFLKPGVSCTPLPGYPCGYIVLCTTGKYPPPGTAIECTATVDTCR